MRFLRQFSCQLILACLCSFKGMASGKTCTARFVSLKPHEVNLRVGPGQNYPTDWVYLKAGFPVEIIAEFDVWRKIRDFEGTQGWVHQSMLCGKRHALVQDPEVLVHTHPDLQSPPLVRLQRGVLVDLVKCVEGWCQIRGQDFKGWVRREVLWGVYPTEKIG